VGRPKPGTIMWRLNAQGPWRARRKHKNDERTMAIWTLSAAVQQVCEREGLTSSLHNPRTPGDWTSVAVKVLVDCCEWLGYRMGSPGHAARNVVATLDRLPLTAPRRRYKVLKNGRIRIRFGPSKRVSSVRFVCPISTARS
jgi:hypothetical protein